MNKQKFKVLHIISGYGGGVSSHIRNLANAIDQNKITFDVAGFTEYGDEFKDVINQTNGKTFVLPRPKKSGLIQYIKSFASILKKNGPYDVVQCHIPGYRALFIKLLCSFYGVKRFVLHAHTTFDESDRVPFEKLKGIINRFINRRIATQMLSCSSEASLFIFGKKPLKRNNIMHLPNSIDYKKFVFQKNQNQVNSLKRKLNIPENSLIVGHVGRFNEVKNHNFMVEIIKYMAKNNNNFVWLFIGTGELENTIKQMVNKEGLESYVRFLGRREDVNKIYQLFDVLILPSLAEGLPTVVIEAQAAGIPSLISSTITREADLGIGLVEYISLNKSIEDWINALRNLANLTIPSIDTRIKILKKKKFTNKEAANLYEEFLTGKRTNYNILS